MLARVRFVLASAPHTLESTYEAAAHAHVDHEQDLTVLARFCLVAKQARVYM